MSEESADDSKQLHHQRRQREPDGCPDKESTGAAMKSMQRNSKSTKDTIKTKESQNNSSSAIKRNAPSSKPGPRTSASRKVVDGQDIDVNSKGGVSLEPQLHGKI